LIITFNIKLKKYNFIGLDYYSILGVSRTASTDDINKAYKKLVVTKHPDKIDKNSTDAEKAEATKQFHLIQKAKEILSDPEKRPLYDQYGESAMNETISRQSSMKQQMKLQDMKHVITCTLSELYHGAPKTISFTRQIVAGNIFGGQLNLHGEEKCSITLNVPPRTLYSQQIKLPNQGMRHLTEDVYGDLVLVINPVEPIPPTEIGWKQDDQGNLTYNLDLSFPESLLGFNRTITHPSGEEIKLYSNDSINTISKIVSKKGFKDNTNLIVNITVSEPKLTPTQRGQLAGIFNYAPPVPQQTGVNLLTAKTHDKSKAQENMFNIGSGGIRIGGMNFGNLFNPTGGMNFNFGFG